MSSTARLSQFILSLFVLLSCLAPCLAQNNPNERQLFLIWDERGKYGFIDEGGRVVIKPQYDGALPFSEGLAGISVGNKWGFIDTTGKTVIPPVYRAVARFSDGIAAVNIAGDGPTYPCGYVDHAGQFVIKPQNKFSCHEFHEGYATVSIYDEGVGESLDGYINKQGEVAMGGRFALAADFSEGWARVNDFAKTFFINDKGGEIDLRGYAGNDTLSDQYVPVGSFSEGLAEVGIKVFHSYGYWRYGFINKKGKVVFELPERMRVEGAFHDGRALVLQERTEKVRVDLGDEVITMEQQVAAYGYVNAAGKLVIAARFSEAEDFSDGLAAVKTGAPKPANERDMAGSAAEQAMSQDEGRWVCINLAGRVVVKRCGEPLTREEVNLKFPHMVDTGFGQGFMGGLFFNKTYVAAERAGGERQAVFGYMDKSGKYVWIQPHGKNVVPPKWWRENFK